MSKISVFIVDNDQLLIHSLIKLLKEFEDIAIIGRANSGSECIEKLKGRMPDIILMDIRMEHSREGFETAKKILQIYEKKVPQIIFLSVSDNHEDVDEAVKLGLPFINKSVDIQILVDKIKEVHQNRNQFILIPQGLKGKNDKLNKQKILNELTPRELQVLCLIGIGEDHVDIAEKLNIHITTVHLHKKNIRNKLIDFDLKNDVKFSQLVNKYNLCEAIDFSKLNK